jgi:hypothetical protein
MSDLVELAGRRFLEILPWKPPLVREIVARPAVRAITRLEADRYGVVTTPRHEAALLEEPIRTVACLLDGSRDLRALTQELSRRLDSGEIVLGASIEGPDRLARLAEGIKRAVAQIRDLGLLAPVAMGETPKPPAQPAGGAS